MLTRWSKLWIAITVIALFLYNLRWIYGNIETVFSNLQSSAPFASYPEWRFWVDRVLSGLVGNGFRLAGNITALIILFMLWRTKPAPFNSVKRKVSWALICEAIYWLTVLPISTIELFYLQRAQLLELAFIVQIILTSSLLIVLATKMWNYAELNKTNTLKWAGVAGIGYLVGIWCNNVFRWFTMAQITQIFFILTGRTGLGFLSTLVTLSISLIFAVESFRSMFKKQNTEQAIRMAGVSLIFLGLNFVIYLTYSALANSLNYVFLVEFWPITALGLGAGMLRGRI